MDDCGRAIVTFDMDDKALKAIDTFLEKGLGANVSCMRYNNAAGIYDSLAEDSRYRGPAKLADIMTSLFPTNRDRVKILDVAAGTGLAALEMSKVGFTQIDAVDPSQGMLDVAKERNVYRRMICDYVDDRHQLDVQDNCYDAITICGGMGNNHLPPGAFDEMIRVVKPGGVIGNVTRIQLFTGMDDYVDILEPHFRKLETSGKWREESRTTFSKYHSKSDGMALVHRVLS